MELPSLGTETTVFKASALVLGFPKSNCQQPSGVVPGDGIYRAVLE